MSVPLDRLYNHLDGLCNHDILIYRFFPHGSKNLEDLSALDDIDQLGWQAVLKPGAICHDQEPLWFEQYSDSAMLNYFLSFDAEQVNEPGLVDRLKTTIKDQHLRSMTDSRHNVYDKTLLIHSEKNSTNLTKYSKAGFVGVYWWAHAALAIDWFRYAQDDPKLAVNLENITKDFLIYNRAWSGTREYRLKFTEHIVNANLHDHCVMRFNTACDGNNYQDFQPANTVFKTQRTDLENYFEPCQVDATASADYSNLDYEHSAIEVVLETLFDDSRWHLTEKALRPIACGRPFILAATAGSLEYMRSYGFKTFDGLINEEYDTIQDPAERLQKICNEMKRIAQLPLDQKQQLWQDLYAISDYNKKLFFSKEWQQTIFDEFVTNANAGLLIMEQHKTGKYWRKFYLSWKQDPTNKRFRFASKKTIMASLLHAEEIEQLLRQ
jgi:hypothetical protein